MKALLVGNGRAPRRAGLPASVFANVGLVVAADGGAAACESLGLRPDLVIGDLDSADSALIQRLVRAGTEVQRVPAEKDQSDLELALEVAIERGADRLLVLGALGGPRVEHELAAIALLELALERHVEMALVDERSTLQLLAAGPLDGRRDAAPGTAEGGAARGLTIEGQPGDYVSLFALGAEALDVTTDGLRYPLRREPLRPGPSRGLSNELTGPTASVRCGSGRLLVIHTRRSAVASAGQERGSEE
ncbi:MAG: thiamine diphosphokinase [Candidatus Limnocylindrales bacterium]